MRRRPGRPGIPGAALLALGALTSLHAAPSAGAQPAAPPSTKPGAAEPGAAPSSSSPPVPLTPPSPPLSAPSRPAGSAAATPPGVPAVPAFLAKKDQDLADKRARAAAPPPALVTRVGQKPAPLINILHRWTLEVLPVEATGPLPPMELQNRLLRDHFTNASVEMAGKLVPALIAAARTFRVARVDIVSGYRHPKYNLILRKKGHEVARDSAHTHGIAVDFRLPGVTTPRLAAWAQARRMGGVGTYLQSQFVHIDVGPVRRWSGE